MSHLRFTDRWPPTDLLGSYPNWEVAHGEEGRRGQDETTIRPSRQRHYIIEETAYTVADAYLSEGDSYPALLHLVELEPVQAVVFERGGFWSVSRDRLGLWQPDTYDRSALVVDLADATRFPLRLISRLTTGPRGEYIRVQVLPSGELVPWDGKLV